MRKENSGFIAMTRINKRCFFIFVIYFNVRMQLTVIIELHFKETIFYIILFDIAISQ